MVKRGGTCFARGGVVGDCESCCGRLAVGEEKYCGSWAEYWTISEPLRRKNDAGAYRLVLDKCRTAM